MKTQLSKIVALVNSILRSSRKKNELKPDQTSNRTELSAVIDKSITGSGA